MAPLMFDLEATANRFIERPGYRFVSYRGVGIAVFAMNVRILSIESRPVPPINEFIIRLMMEGVKSLSLLSDILGLDQDVIRSCLVDLRRQEIIEVLTDNGSNEVQCVLTSRGKVVANSLRQSVMQEVTVPNLIFHGLLRRPVDLGGFARSQYLRPMEAEEFGLDLVRAIPNRSPYPEEIEVDDVDKVIKRVHRGKPGESPSAVVAVKSVLKNVRILYEPAVMIEYETLGDRRERLVSFIIGNQLRTDYENAFLKARGPELLAHLMAPKEETIEKRIRAQVSPQIVDKLGRFDDVETLAARVMVAKQDVKDKQQQIAALERVDTKEKQRRQIEELERSLGESERKMGEVERERDARKVKHLWTPEIKEKLWEAIRTAKERLLLLSGWISSEVVNEVMANEIRKALMQGVKIWMGYGFDKDRRRGREQRESPRWKEAEATLLRIQKDFPDQFVFKDIGWNHEKRLICDESFTFGGSFNLLSFSGEKRGDRRLRHEGTDLIQDPDFCKEIWKYYLDLFFSS